MPQDTLSKEIFHPRDIIDQEQRMRVVLGDSTILEPILANTIVNKEEILAVLWLSDIDDHKYFFPISKPSCKEFEYSTLSEWAVIFLGLFEQLATTTLTRHFGNLSAGPDNGIFCLLAVNHCIRGLNGEDMSRMIFPCCVTSRVKEEKLITPKMFCNERWRPVRNPLILGLPATNTPSCSIMRS